MSESVTGSCPTLRLMVAGQSVSTDLTTEFKHTTCSDVASGQMLRVRGSMQSNGSVLAERIVNRHREDDDNDEDGDVEVRDGKVEGVIASVTGTCPALTITVGSTTPATVTTTSATEFDDVDCSTLATGMDIEAEGVTQGDGSLLATKVEPRGIVLQRRR
jgi:hypothetical protein